MNKIFTIEKVEPSYTTIKHGYLYNGYVVNSTPSIANTGWRIPTEADFNEIQSILVPNASFKIREENLEYWNGTYGHGDLYLFHARGSGMRAINGTFSLLKEECKYRTSTSGTLGLKNAWLYWEASLVCDSGPSNKEGYSIRLVRDNPTLEAGSVGSYTGNDGKVYRTTRIGNLEWMSDNLAETKWSNGTSIPIITNNTLWSNDISGAMCSYNNDGNNV